MVCRYVGEYKPKTSAINFEVAKEVFSAIEKPMVKK